MSRFLFNILEQNDDNKNEREKIISEAKQNNQQTLQQCK